MESMGRYRRLNGSKVASSLKSDVLVSSVNSDMHSMKTMVSVCTELFVLDSRLSIQNDASTRLETTQH